VRFSDPAAGCIRLGDMDVRAFAESDLQRHISVVTQQPHMFNATLRENLLMARPGAGDDELLAALNSAQLLDFVNSQPDGLGTWIGGDGQTSIRRPGPTVDRCPGHTSQRFSIGA